MTNLDKTREEISGTSPVLQAILKEFNKKYHLEDDWDFELYQKVPSGLKNVNREVEEFLSQALTKYSQALLEEIEKLEPIAECINNNQPGWNNIVETKPFVTILVGEKLYTESQIKKELAEMIVRGK